MSEEAKESLLVAMRNTLPKVKETGCLLIEAKRLCRKSGTLWEPWVRENCGLSERMLRRTCVSPVIGRNSRSAERPPSSIDGALKWLAQPKENPEPSKNKGPVDPGDDAEGDHANDAAIERGGKGADGADTTAPEEPAPERGDPPDITPERRRQLEDTLKNLIRQRDRLTKEIFLAIANLVFGLVAGVRDGAWEKRDRWDLSKVADRMMASLISIRSAPVCQELPSDSARR